MWNCSCGQYNEGKFCTNCGAPKPQTTLSTVSGFPRRRDLKAEARERVSKQRRLTVNATYLSIVGVSTLISALSASFMYIIIFVISLISVLSDRGLYYNYEEFENAFLSRMWWLFLLMAVLIILVEVFFTNVYKCGEYSVSLHIRRGQELHTEHIFNGFTNYRHTLLGMLRYIVFLSLWLLVPVYGIMRKYSYKMVPYILMDRPELSPREAMSYSRAIMHGHRWQLFMLYLSFAGWYILNALTFGILGIFFLFPYYDTTVAGFYEAVVKDYERS